MDIRQMKNMIVLKDLPSNIVEEAFVVLKKDVKLHKKEISENKKNKVNESKFSDQNNYVIKEAEFILKEYIDKIESKNSYNKQEIIVNKFKKKYNRLKYLAIFLGVFCSILTISIILR